MPIPPTKPAGSIPATAHCLYKFQCSGCSSCYLGRTDRNLRERIGEHIPVWVKQFVAAARSNPNLTTTRQASSSIAKHLLENKCVVNTDSAFSIIYRNDNQKLLRFAEAVAISRHKPTLCKQAKWVMTLRLPWGQS